MGETSRVVEAAIVTTLFMLCALAVNYTATRPGDQSNPVTAKIERGPSRIAAN